MKISQREARRLRKRVTELEQAVSRQRSVYAQEWLGGIDIGREAMETTTATAIRTARRLGHAVVAVGDETDTVRFIALQHPKVVV